MVKRMRADGGALRGSFRVFDRVRSTYHTGDPYPGSGVPRPRARARARAAGRGSTAHRRGPGPEGVAGGGRDLPPHLRTASSPGADGVHRGRCGRARRGGGARGGARQRRAAALAALAPGRAAAAREERVAAEDGSALARFGAASASFALASLALAGARRARGHEGRDDRPARCHREATTRAPTTSSLGVACQA